MLSNFFSYLYMKIEYNNGLLVVVSWVRLLLIRKLFKQIFIWEIMFRIERVNTSIRFLFIFIQFSYLSNFNFFFKSFTSFDWISPIFDWLNQFRLILIKLIDYDLYILVDTINPLYRYQCIIEPETVYTKR